MLVLSCARRGTLQNQIQDSKSPYNLYQKCVRLSLIWGCTSGSSLSEIAARLTEEALSAALVAQSLPGTLACYALSGTAMVSCYGCATRCPVRKNDTMVSCYGLATQCPVLTGRLLLPGGALFTSDPVVTEASEASGGSSLGTLGFRVGV
eukprot:444324-Rhodomonas_salina.2